MKRIGMFTLVLVYLLGLMLTGCRPAGSGQSSDSAPETTEQAPIFTQISDPDVTVPKTPLEQTPDGTDVSFGNVGKVRVAYTINRSSVQYVTSVAGLPQCEELAKYDEAYFKDHALLVVYETVGSGSVEVGISAIHADGGIAAVTLSHEMPGQVGTTDMATWLIWAEVDKDLDYRWEVTNPVYKSEESKY